MSTLEVIGSGFLIASGMVIFGYSLEWISTRVSQEEVTELRERIRKLERDL